MSYRSHSWTLLFLAVAASTCSFSGCEPESSPRKLATAAKLEVYVVSAAKVPNSRAAVDTNSNATIYLTSPPVITSADVATVQRSEEDSHETPSLTVNLTPIGATKLASATTPAARQKLAVVVNGNVIAVATVIVPLSNRVQISGGPIQKDREQIFDTLTNE